MALSKTQVDKLGERLKTGASAELDLRQLDEYRRSFSVAAEYVMAQIHARTALSPTARPAKSTKAIIEKLLRQDSRLTQIQDIAGCRLLVDTLAQQNEVVSQLRQLFSETRIIDRRLEPSHGYRAVHVIVTHDARQVEVQVRTELQHRWAAWSEKVADAHGHEIKYGAGPEGILFLLQELSRLVRDYEESEDFHRRYPGRDVRTLGAERQQLAQLFESLNSRLPAKKGQP